MGRVGRRVGSSRPAVAGIDSLIAATSLQHDLTVVTRNSLGFERCGARTFNPWVEK